MNLIVPFSWFLLIFLISLLSGKVVSDQCLEDQKSLLLMLKANLTTSSSSSRLVSWDGSTDCCLWDGITCDKSGHVIKLELDNQTISGEIANSSSLFELQHLESLNLAYNSLYSIIPPGLYKLRNLTYLNLSNALFYGQISTDLGLMRRLVILDLSTHFPGFDRLEVENANLKVLFRNLTKLEELYLDGVNISAPGNEWCNAFSSLSGLRVLSLYSCYLSGPIDTSLLQLSSLSVINLSDNNLSAPVPEFFANFGNLRSLSLCGCNLQGSFPQKIMQVPSLQTIDLSNNDFLTGNIPKLPTNGSFREIVLSYTKFSGSLPRSIGLLGNLSKIDLSCCNFSGPIPSTMENLQELVYVDLSNNRFNGSIPSFHLSKKLKHIDLSRNYLTGTILPTQFEGLAELYYINFGFNSMEGIIPPSLFTLQSLEKLLLSNNRFQGPVSEFPNASTSLLDTLDLSGNRLEGSIPNSFFELRRLIVLSLSSNGFNGTLQLQMINRLPNLLELDLSHNFLLVEMNSTDSYLPQLTELKLVSCSLHAFPNLKNQQKITILDLSENSIAGEIMTWIWEIGNGNLQHLNLSHNLLSSLQSNYTMGNNILVLDLHSNLLRDNFPIPPPTAPYVDYSNNNFNNSIPASIGSFLTYVIYFSLSNNRLTGTIPESICDASNLLVLDLSNNTLTGNLPGCLFGSMESLHVLQLRSNNIYGTIPDNFAASCVLKTLDLSENDLTGKVPQSIVNCTSLEVLNIGTNQIEDTFPCMLKDSSSLRLLVLRSNMFHGNLSCSQVNNSWQNLQIIDIAMNRFSGNLSSSISYWTGIILGGNGTPGQDIHTDVLSLSNLNYQDSVRMYSKGNENVVQKILVTFAAIDFSFNQFQGTLPETIGNLRRLVTLNLSHNSLTSLIPSSIGHLNQLESLDLSFNHLNGEIPSQISNLTFLSFFNVSYNNLVGAIPTGSQIQTFTETSFLGNIGLCGFPVNRSCNSSSSPEFPALPPKEEEPVHDWDIYVSAAMGFLLSLIVMFWSLVCNNNWRKRYNNVLNKLVLKTLCHEGCF